VKVALLNPPWTFAGSVYFGCQDPHLPLEYGYAGALLEAAGHDVCLVDCQLEELELDEARRRLRHFDPDMTVLTTAPSYLFWRCAPPELRVAIDTADALRDVAGRLVVIGPHASTTPATTLRKLRADVALLGEAEQTLVELANRDGDAHGVDGAAERDGAGTVTVRGKPRAADMQQLPALRWPTQLVARHRHHHHRFDPQQGGPGAELEASRGCPYACSFCAKDNFRNRFRRRPLDTVLAEVDALVEQGVEYVYFVDEIFMPDVELLQALVERRVRFGVQLRIDLFDFDTLELLGRAGCVSIEAGVESVTPQGRSLLAKRCKLSTEQLCELLLHAKRHVPFVQANLLEAETDSRGEIDAFRRRLRDGGVWANDPVPMFAYPGSPAYVTRWGLPDDQAWERAHTDYLSRFSSFSDLQAAAPQSLAELERGAHA
jgi:anaerobic magnesium-protoporphyrin IX monomethyl ester cyclase